MNAETGGVENVSRAATTAEQRESLVKVLETMAWPSLQLSDIRTDIPRIISGFEANLHRSCGPGKPDSLGRDEKNGVGPADETAGPVNEPVGSRFWAFGIEEPVADRFGFGTMSCGRRHLAK